MLELPKKAATKGDLSESVREKGRLESIRGSRKLPEQTPGDSIKRDSDRLRRFCKKP